MERCVRNALGARLALVLFPALLLVGGTAYAASAQPGPEVELLDETLTNWSSNLPVVIINTSGQEILRERISVSVRVMDSGNGRTRLTGAADFDGRAQLHLRGHTSLRYPKRSYRLKLCDPDAHPQKDSLLGLPESSDWILYAPYPDKTLMRDVLAYELSNQMGRYAPRTRFVELFLNHSGVKLSPRHYMGVFVLEEKIKRAKERLALEKLGPADNAEPAITGGYIFKKDHLDPIEVGPPNIGGFPNSTGPPPILRPGFPTGPGGFPGDPQSFLPPQGGTDANSGLFFLRGERLVESREGFASPHGSIFLYVEPKAEEITQSQRRWLGQYIRKLEGALYGPEFRDPVKGYNAYLDPDSFIDYHSLVEATKNVDGFRFSTFFQKERGGKLKMGPIWDWNLSFGAANGKQGHLAEYWYWPQLDDQQYSWYRRLFEDPDFAQKYVDRWGELRTNQFAVARILARIDELAALLNEAQARNFRRWRILGRQVWPDFYTGKSYSDEVQYMKNWIAQRLTWIDRQFVAGPTFSLAEGHVATNSKLAMRASVGKVYYTLDGSDPRAPGGTVSAHAQLYKAAVNLNGDTVVLARALAGNRWSWPSKARFTCATGTESVLPR